MLTPLAPTIEFTPISESYSRVLRLRSVVALLVELVLLGIAVFFVRDSLPWWVFAGMAVVFVLCHGIGFGLARRRSRAIGYVEGEDELLVCSGIMFRKLQTIPYGRMQQVDVEDGPFLRRYGLAKVTMTTASSSATGAIPGIVRDEADRLRELLTERGDARMEGL